MQSWPALTAWPMDRLTARDFVANEKEDVDEWELPSNEKGREHLI